MTKPHTHLNYEFYYLFQFESHVVQPLQLRPEMCVAGLHTLRVDKDKRLFRWDVPIQTELTDWGKQLQISWRRILDCYQRAYPDLTESAVRQLLMGVAVLIMDETIDAFHLIDVALPEGIVTFAPALEKVPSERFLLTITDETSASEKHLDRMVQPARFEEFQPNWSQPDRHWQLEILPLADAAPDSDSPQPRLIPMQNSEQQQNPIFAVFGLAHGKLTDNTATWPEQLQKFLCSSKTAVFARVMPRLLMQRWQFARLDLVAHTVRQQLDNSNARYHQISDQELECASHSKLEKTLTAMAKLEATVKQTTARLEGGVKTLEINRNNVAQQLQHSQETWQVLETAVPPASKHDWQLPHIGPDDPLLSGFNLDIRRLQNHLTYLRNDLTYLDSLRKRWELQLDERKLEIGECIGLFGHLLIFLVAVGEVINLLAHHAKQTGQPDSASHTVSPGDTWLSYVSNHWLDWFDWIVAPELYIFLILLFLLWLGYRIFKVFLWRKVRCGWWALYRVVSRNK